MSIKQASYSLLLINVLLIGIFTIYLVGPFDPGVYLMGIGVLCLLMFCSIVLILFAKRNIFIKLNMIRPVSLLILVGNLLTISALGYIFFIWFIFMPWK